MSNMKRFVYEPTEENMNRLNIGEILILSSIDIELFGNSSQNIIIDVKNGEKNSLIYVNKNLLNRMINEGKLKTRFQFPPELQMKIFSYVGTVSLGITPILFSQCGNVINNLGVEAKSIIYVMNRNNIFLNPDNYMYISDLSIWANVRNPSLLYELPNLRKLKISGIQHSLNFLHTLTTLTELSLQLITYDCLEDSLSYLTNLKKLKFGTSFNEDIDNLQSLTKLTHLEFGTSFNKSISVLSNFTNIKYLKFGHCFNKNLNSLRELTSLKYLQLGRHFDHSLEPLSKLNLSDIVTNTQRNHPEIGVLSSLSKLTHLKLSMNSHTLEPLSGITSLIYLSLLCGFNKPIDALSNLTNLKTLHIGNNFNQPIDALSNLTNLTRLSIGFNINSSHSVDSLS